MWELVDTVNSFSLLVYFVVVVVKSLVAHMRPTSFRLLPAAWVCHPVHPTWMGRWTVSTMETTTLRQVGTWKALPLESLSSARASVTAHMSGRWHSRKAGLQTEGTHRFAEARPHWLAQAQNPLSPASKSQLSIPSPIPLFNGILMAA